MSNETKDSIALKWGTWKHLGLKSEAVKKVADNYEDLKWSGGAMSQVMTDEHKKCLCEIIDASNCDEILLDWEGEYVSKEKAKEYIMDYGKKKEPTNAD